MLIPSRTVAPTSTLVFTLLSRCAHGFRVGGVRRVMGVPENPDVIAPGMAHWRTMYPGVKVRPSCRHKQFYHTHSIHTSGHPLTCSVPTLTTTTFSARTTTRVEPEGVCVGQPRPFRGLLGARWYWWYSFTSWAFHVPRLRARHPVARPHRISTPVSGENFEDFDDEQPFYIRPLHDPF